MVLSLAACENLLGGSKYSAGLYDANGNLIASWDTLISTYGMDVSEDYTPDGYSSSTSTPFYILRNNEELSEGVKLVISDSVTRIGELTFSECESLTSIVIPDSVKTIGHYAFKGCSSLKSVAIGNGVTSIGSYAFSRCSSLTSIVIPDGVTIISYGTFFGCSSLTNIAIPDSVTRIGAYALSDCSSLTSIKIPDSVTSIGNFAFSGCSLITRIEVPDSVTIIGSSAFYGCSSLTSVVIGDGVTSIGEDVFINCSSLTSIEVSENNTSYKSIDGNLYNKSGKYLIQYAVGRVDPSFTVPDSVTVIGCSAFRACSSLTSIVIPDSVVIRDEAFFHCSSLESVVIGNRITSIGYGAFADCPSLKNVYYAGTEEEWAGISIGTYNDDLTNATIHHNCAPEE